MSEQNFTFNKIKYPLFIFWIKNKETSKTYGIVFHKYFIQLSYSETEAFPKRAYSEEEVKSDKNLKKFLNDINNTNQSLALITERLYKSYFDGLKKDRITLKDENGKEICRLKPNDNWEFFLTKFNGKNCPFKLESKLKRYDKNKTGIMGNLIPIIH